MTVVAPTRSRRDYSRHIGVGAAVCGALLLLIIVVLPIGKEGYSNHTRVQADIQGISTQLNLYASMNGFFPTTGQGLRALVTEPTVSPHPPRWYQLYKETPRDPWGNPYVYRRPGTKHAERTISFRRVQMGSRTQKMTIGAISRFLVR